MAQKGKRSRASLELVAQVGETQVNARAEPPEYLSDNEASIWRRIVNAVSADWFSPENYDLLVQYCRHVDSSERVRQLIRTFEADEERFNVEDYDRLLKMQEREGRALSSLATRMRISQQGTLDREKRKKSKPEVPWTQV